MQKSLRFFDNLLKVRWRFSLCFIFIGEKGSLVIYKSFTRPNSPHLTVPKQVRQSGKVAKRSQVWRRNWPGQQRLLVQWLRSARFGTAFRSRMDGLGCKPSLPAPYIANGWLRWLIGGQTRSTVDDFVMTVGLVNVKWVCWCVFVHLDQKFDTYRSYWALIGCGGCCAMSSGLFLIIYWSLANNPNWTLIYFSSLP